MIRQAKILCLPFCVAAIAACGGQKKTPPQPATNGDASASALAAPGDASVAQAVGPKGPPAAVEAAEQLLKTPLTDAESARRARDAADALERWATDNTTHERAGEAARVTTELRLLAAASALDLGPDKADEALGGSGALSRLLRQALTRAAEAPAGDSDARTAVMALLAVADPGAKDAAVDLDKAVALLNRPAAGSLAAAVRLAWMGHLQRALADSGSAPTHARVTTLSQRAGTILCGNCADAHRVAPATLAKYLIGARTPAGGLICPSARSGLAAADTLAKQVALLGACPDLAVDAAELGVHAGGNSLFIAAISRAAALAALPTAEGPLSKALASRAAALRETLSRPMRLPEALVTEAASLADDPPRTAPRAITGLGFAGLSVASSPPDTFVIGPEGVRAGLKPAVGVRDGKLVSMTGELNLDRDPVMSLSALAEAELDSETGAVTSLVDAVAAVRSAAAPTASDEPGIADVVVDADAPSNAVIRTLDALAVGGYSALRFAKTETHGRMLPLVVRQAPPELAAAAGFERPVIVHLKSDAIDVWAPAKQTGDLAAKDTSAKPPAAAEPGYRGTDLVRLRIPTTKADERGLTEATVGTVSQAADYWLASSGAGPLVHIVSADTTRAADVLRIARAVQEVTGRKVLPAPETIWAGTRCAAVAGDAKADVCPSAVAIAFSRAAAPSSRGITDKPRAKQAAKPRPAAPSAEFCNDRDIQVKMRKRAGRFRFCYERQLQLEKNLSGRVVTNFTIGLDGKVKSARIASSTLKHDKTHACLLKEIRKVSFAKPDGGTCAVRWPFKFQQR